jgi:hypothetical protein
LWERNNMVKIENIHLKMINLSEPTFQVDRPLMVISSRKGIKQANLLMAEALELPMALVRERIQGDK